MRPLVEVVARSQVRVLGDAPSNVRDVLPIGTYRTPQASQRESAKLCISSIVCTALVILT
jgi:hypothetical protein